MGTIAHLPWWLALVPVGSHLGHLVVAFILCRKASSDGREIEVASRPFYFSVKLHPPTRQEDEKTNAS